eukprot:1149165-Pelagomonas_calceolata.AAC.7
MGEHNACKCIRVGNKRALHRTVLLARPMLRRRAKRGEQVLEPPCCEVQLLQNWTAAPIAKTSLPASRCASCDFLTMPTARKQHNAHHGCLDAPTLSSCRLITDHMLSIVRGRKLVGQLVFEHRCRMQTSLECQGRAIP